jgi:hypothetical protein
MDSNPMFFNADESLTSIRHRKPKGFRNTTLAAGEVDVLIKIMTALVATAMLATAIGASPSFAQNAGATVHYDSSGAPTGPY